MVFTIQSHDSPGQNANSKKVQKNSIYSDVEFNVIYDNKICKLTDQQESRRLGAGEHKQGVNRKNKCHCYCSARSSCVAFIWVSGGVPNR